MMTDCKPASTPLAAKVHLTAHDGALLDDATEFRQLVGSLQYLTLTRPDISFTVSTVAQFLSAPRLPHMVAVKRILRYIKGSIGHGYLIFLGSTLISWCSKKQPTIARSSAESEYRSLAHACAETVWVSFLLHELGCPVTFPSLLYCDNISATYLAANPVHHARTRHIELDYHFVREKVALGSHRVLFVPSDDQLADVLTKGLHK
ncbi:hypothetical protein Q3G72_002864 [Acer saccharum]|nr:hypothetical protein Q3G72_002864 [Acer saccharum]